MTIQKIFFQGNSYTNEPNPLGDVSVNVCVAGMSGPVALSTYNLVASNLGKSRVNRFADLATARKRTWEILVAWASQSEDDFVMGEEELAAQKGRAAVQISDEDKAPLVKEASPRRGNPVSEALIEVAADKAVLIQAQTKLRNSPPASDNPAKDAEMPALRRALKPIELECKSRVYARKEGSKQAILVDLLSRPEGATFGELYDALAATGKPWKGVTIRSGLAWDINHIAGYGVSSELLNGEQFVAQGRDYEAQRLGIVGDERGHFNLPGPGYDPELKLAVYRLTYPKGMDAPLPHLKAGKKA